MGVVPLVLVLVLVVGVVDFGKLLDDTEDALDSVSSVVVVDDTGCFGDVGVVPDAFVLLLLLEEDDVKVMISILPVQIVFNKASRSTDSSEASNPRMVMVRTKVGVFVPGSAEGVVSMESVTNQATWAVVPLATTVCSKA